MSTIGFTLLRVLVELAGVTLATSNGRHIWSVDIFPRQAVPCHFREPRMVLDILRAAVQVAKPLREIRRDELRKQVDRIGMHIRWILDLSSKDILIDLHGGTTVPERCKAAQHLKDQNTE